MAKYLLRNLTCTQPFSLKEINKYKYDNKHLMTMINYFLLIGDNNNTNKNTYCSGRMIFMMHLHYFRKNETNIRTLSGSLRTRGNVIIFVMTILLIVIVFLEMDKESLVYQNSICKSM
jgi:hypothetical protein